MGNIMTGGGETEIGLELRRIADALERITPPPLPFDATSGSAYIWHADPEQLERIDQVNRVDLDLLKGIELVRDQLLENTSRFADGLPANNALLWGARGMGKSSLVKAVHAQINHSANGASGDLALIEIHREDIMTLPRLMALLKDLPRKFILFCDDLSFDTGDATYKSLKAVLEGGLEGRPPNMIFYATSNRRHLMPRDMVENERSTAINPSEAVEEKVSLSDRFGLWLGFHSCNQEEFMSMIEAYADHFDLQIERSALRDRAVEWSVTRGARSGRVAWQFIQDLCGELGVNLK